MIRYFLSVLIVLFYYNSLCAQFTYFSRIYNPNNTFSTGNSIIEYIDNYYISGTTADSIGQYRSVFISSVNANGDLLFWKTYGKYPYSYWAGYTNSLISSTNLGELVLSGSRSRSGHGGTGTYYNFDTNGDTIYTVQYPDTNYIGQTIFYQVRQTTDNGFVFVGTIAIEQYDSDIFLLKSDNNGHEQWRKHFGKPVTWSIDHGYNILETADSGYLIGYYFHVAGQEHTGNPYLLKVNNLGDYEWELNLGGPFEDYLATICSTNDGNYMCAASISDSASNDLLFTRVNITKVSTDGNIIWKKTVGKQHLWNKVFGIYQAHDEGYIMCGFRHDSVTSIGFLNSCAWICKVDKDGDSLWWREYEYFDDPEFHDNKFYDLHLTSDGGYIAVGQTSTVYDPQQTWLLKVDSFGCDTPGCQTVGIVECQNISQGSLLIYPNPASDQIHCQLSIVNCQLSIAIYDLFGRKIDEITIPKGQEQTQINVSSYPQGIYIAVLRDSKRIIDRKKFVVSR